MEGLSRATHPNHSPHNARMHSATQQHPRPFAKQRKDELREELRMVLLEPKALDVRLTAAGEHENLQPRSSG